MAPPSLQAMPTRDAVAALIHQHPGITQRTLQQHLGVAWGTIAHHIQRLLDDGLVESLTSHRRRSLFPPHVPSVMRPRLAVLRQAPAEAVHAHLLRAGRSREYQVADALGLGRRVVRRALHKMHDAGLVTRFGHHTAWYEAVALSPIQAVPAGIRADGAWMGVHAPGAVPSVLA